MNILSRTLVVFPGAGDPASPLYQSVYLLLEQLAKDHGYSEVSTDVRWPGHLSVNNLSLTLGSSVDLAMKRLSLLDGHYDLLARSFGCFVALKCENMLPPTNKPSRIMLWGPPPFWLVWQMFIRDFTENASIARDKGVQIGEDFFPSIEPVESLLQNITTPTIVTSGSLDPYCSPSFLDYLKNIVMANEKVIVREPIKGAKHEVARDSDPELINAYSNALFV